MSRVLFVLSDEISIPIEEAKRALVQILQDEKIDVTVTVSSKDILKYTEDLKKYYKDTYSEDLNLNILIINDLDNLDYVFERINNKIQEFLDSEIIIDYTYGSSRLTTIAIIIAKLYGLKIQQKLELEDTAKISKFDVVEEKNMGSIMYIIKKLFNNYNFVIAKEFLEEKYNSPTIVKEMFSSIIDLYLKWDSFEYVDKDYTDLIEFFKNLEILPKNIQSLKILTDKNNELYNTYRIADLINNSKRRIEEKKYDDAIIRLYRTLELIAEVQLAEKYGIKKNDIHINELKELNIEKKATQTIIDRLDYKYPKYNLSLTSSFFLLQKLYDNVGKHYYHNKESYQQLFQKRNISILVHGSYTYDIDEVNRMYELVLSMSMIYDKNMTKYLENLTFPKFKI